MARFCPNCGSELEELTNFCANCGTPVITEEPAISSESESSAETDVVAEVPQDYTTGDAVQEEQVPKKKKKFLPLIIVGAAVLALIVSMAFLWKPIALRVAPHSYLNWALSNSAKEQEKRNEGSPYELLGSASNASEKGSVIIEADYEPTGADATNIKLHFSGDRAAKCWSVDAAATAMGESYDISMYMDSDCVALGTSLFDDGTYYGLTYESVAEDIRSSVLGEILTEDQMNEFIEAIEQLDAQMDEDVDDEEVLKPYMQIISDFYEELDADIGKEKIQVGKKSVKCDTIAFTMDEEAVMDLLDALFAYLKKDDNIREAYFSVLSDDQWNDLLTGLDENMNSIGDDMTMEMTITYYLRRNKVVAWNVTTELVDSYADETIDMELMITYDKDIVYVDIGADSEGEQIELSVVSEVEKDGDTYTEKLAISGDFDGSEFSGELESKWNRKKGKMTVKLDAEADGESFSGDFTFGLKETDGGFALEIDDLYEILCGIDEDFATENDPFDCSIRISVNDECDISKPGYTNLDQIDEDTLTRFGDVLNAFGGIMGDSEEDNWTEDDWTEDDWTDDDWSDDDWLDDDWTDDEWSDEGFDFGIVPKVIDEADLLTDEQEENLTLEIESFVWMYEMDMIVLTVDTTEGTDILDFAEEYYTWYEYGFGDQSSGVALAYSVTEGEWGMIAFGECSEMLTDESIDAILSDVETSLVASDYEQAFNTFVQSTYEAISEVFWEDIFTDEDIALW